MACYRFLHLPVLLVRLRLRFSDSSRYKVLPLQVFRSLQICLKTRRNYRAEMGEGLRIAIGALRSLFDRREDGCRGSFSF